MPPISNPRKKRVMMVNPIVTARARWPRSQYPAPGKPHEANPTKGVGAENVRGRSDIRAGYSIHPSSQDKCGISSVRPPALALGQLPILDAMRLFRIDPKPFLPGGFVRLIISFEP